MKSTLTILFFITLLFASCQENQDPASPFVNQIFIGTFERLVDNETSQVAEVELRFVNNSFEGSSNLNRFPAICNGTYLVLDNRIKFENSCFWTAEFDWTLILNGEFVVQKNDDSIILTKEFGSGPQKITDIYTLKLKDSQPV